MPNTASRVATRQVPWRFISGGRSPSRSADQLGRHQNPSSSKRSAASLSSAKQLVSVEPSSMVCTTRLAIAGVRSLIIGTASAQDAQYAAVCAWARRSQSQTSHTHWESGHSLSLPHLLCSARDFAKESLGCVPHALIMPLCVLC